MRHIQFYLVNRVQNILRKTTNSASCGILGPLLLLHIVKLVPPEPLHQLAWLNLEPVRVQLCKLLQSKGPAMQARPEPNGSLRRVNHNVAHRTSIFAICRNNNIDIFYDPLERLVQLLGLQLEGQQSKVHLVHKEDWLDSFTDGLAQYGFRLYTDTYAP